jgi:DNA-binding CsgD family transcriptional regulator
MSPQSRPRLRGTVLGQPLSPVELRTLRLEGLGHGHKIVAEIRGVSEYTVKNTLWMAYRKLGVHGLVEALNRLGWVVIPDEDALDQRPSGLPLLADTRAELEVEAVKLTAYSEAAGEAARILAEAAEKVIDGRVTMLGAVEANTRPEGWS